MLRAYFSYFYLFLSDQKQLMADQNQFPNDDDSNPRATSDKADTNPRNRVRRRLDFGPAESEEELLRRLQGEGQENERRKAAEKWNFDFENEIPLPGDWEWEKLAIHEPIANSKDVIESTKDKHKENRNV